jgi:hypothetical protein
MAQAAKARINFRAQLLKALGRVDRPGAICVSRDLPMTMPGLEVEEVGKVRLPLGSAGPPAGHDDASPRR